MRASPLHALLCALALVAPAPSPAANVVIYRCTDVYGALTVQNDVPCPQGSRQQKQVIQPPPPMPAYKPVAAKASVAPAAEQAPPPETPAPAVAVSADKDRLPPPALYQCNTFDNDSYLSESPTPAPRCVRLETTDLQGAADTSGGVACQMMTDQCQRIADGAACRSWKQRMRETEAAWRFSRATDAEANQADYVRVQKIVNDSTCGQ